MSVAVERGDATSTVASTLPTDRVSWSRRQRHWVNPLIVTGGVLLAVIVLFCTIYPFLSPHDPTTPNFTQPPLAPPSAAHLLGTDNFGRDILTRLAYGGRVDLTVTLIGTAGTVIVGALLGLIAGYTGGWLDSLIMRVVDFTLTMPYLILVIAIVAILGPGTQNIVYAIWLVGWVAYARIVRGETLVARRRSMSTQRVYWG